MTIRALFSGVSGLRGLQTAIDVIGNNIANVNTTGYKSGRVVFSDLFSQTISGAAGPANSRGGINPQQIGLGTQVSSIDNIFTQGSLQTTGRLLDLAVQGNGFFALTDGRGGEFLTRAGAFALDKEGYVVNPGNGFRLLGLAGDDTGQISPGSTSSPIRIDTTQQLPARVTQNVEFGGNLSTTAQSRGATALTTLTGLFNADGTPLNLRVGDVIALTGGSLSVTGDAATALVGDVLTITESTTLLDLTLALEAAFEAANANSDVGVEISDGIISFRTSADDTITGMTIGVTGRGGNPLEGIFGGGAGIGVTAGSFANAGLIRQADAVTSIDTYDSQGNPRTVTVAFARDTSQLNAWNWQAIVPHPVGLAPTGDSGSLVFTSNGLFDFYGGGSGAINPVLSFDPDGDDPQNGGVDPMNVTLDFTNMTQFAAPATAAIDAQDGNSVGDLDTITIDPDGIIRGIYSNGVTRDLAQVLLATLPNESGLLKTGDTMFVESANSGEAVLGVANSRGRGSIANGTLELSNVDLANEFTNLIINQRAFQANSRIITTGDQILQEIVNLIR